MANNRKKLHFISIHFAIVRIPIPNQIIISFFFLFTFSILNARHNTFAMRYSSVVSVKISLFISRRTTVLWLMLFIIMARMNYSSKIYKLRSWKKWTKKKIMEFMSKVIATYLISEQIKAPNTDYIFVFNGRKKWFCHNVTPSVSYMQYKGSHATERRVFSTFSRMMRIHSLH